MLKQFTFRAVAAASLILAAIALVLAGVRFWNFAHQPLTPEKSSEAVVQKVIEIPKFARPQRVSEMLFKEGLVSNSTWFFWWGRLFQEWPKLKAGEYQFRSNQTPVEIFSILKSGVSIARPFTIPEGWNMYEIARLMESRGFGTASEILTFFHDPARLKQMGFQDPLPISFEGYLFPETYQFSRDQTVAEVVATLVRHFFTAWKPEWNQRLIELRMTRHELVTLASIIEKETGAAFERPLISGVFHNRLKKRIRLQSDPTTIYGIWARYKGNIRRSDLLEATPYNTYAILGLPIGPIANPGKEAIYAALYPAETNALYFVSKNDGTHVFSTTLNEHNQAVHEYQKNPKARAGKSWRDLKKN